MFRNKPCKCYRNVKSVKGNVPDRVPRDAPVERDEAIAAGSGGAQLRFGRAELPRERRGVFCAQVVRADKLAYQAGVLFKISRRDAAVHGEQPAAVGFAQQTQKLCTRVVYGQVRRSGKERFAPHVIFRSAEHIEAARVPGGDDIAAAEKLEARGDKLLIPRIERSFGGERTYDLRAETARRENYDRLYKLIYNSGYNPNETELSDSGMTGEQASALLAEYRRRNKIGTSNSYTYRSGTSSGTKKTKKQKRYTAPKSTRLASPGRNLDAQEMDENGYELYFLSDPDSAGGGDAIHTQEKRLTLDGAMETEDCVRALMEALLAGPDEPSLSSPIPECPVRSNKTAQITVTGKMNIILFVKFKTDATAIAPKATCDNPSPIKENRFSTKVTPSKEEQSAINTPTIRAYLTNGY